MTQIQRPVTLPLSPIALPSSLPLLQTLILILHQVGASRPKRAFLHLQRQKTLQFTQSRILILTVKTYHNGQTNLEKSAVIPASTTHFLSQYSIVSSTALACSICYLQMAARPPRAAPKDNSYVGLKIKSVCSSLPNVQRVF